jgi:hypothetical protein
MKSMNGKKKSLQIDHTLSELLDSVIYNPIDNTINGIPVSEIEARLSESPKLPLGYKGACYRHEKVLYFKTFDEMTKHDVEKHDYRRG